MRIGVLAVGLLIAGSMAEGMSARRDSCGDVCSVAEYCNKHNSLCTPCSNICDEANYLEKECNVYCRAYLLTRVEHRYEDLRSEVSRLWNFATTAVVVASFSLAMVACLLASRFVRWKSIGGALHRTISGAAWAKTTPTNKSNNDRENNNKPEDAETGGGGGGGGGQHGRNGGPKLVMPTISATVAPSREPAIGRRNNAVVAGGNGSGQTRAWVQAREQGRGNETPGNCSGTENGTPNTTTTTLSLSGRHPCEDTTLDYAYDNPAMTPSPESVQIRRDRESSF